jgi:hypothetical protein
MLATVANVPAIYGAYSNQMGVFKGRFGENFYIVKFPDQTEEPFPIEDVQLSQHDEQVEVNSKDNVKQALQEENKIVWGQIKTFDPYGMEYYLRKGRITGFKGYNFARLFDSAFPFDDVKIDIVDKAQTFNKFTAFYDLEFYPFRIVQYFRDWNFFTLLKDTVEWNFNIGLLSFADMQILYDRAVAEDIWHNVDTTYNRELYAQATLEENSDRPLNINAHFKLLASHPELKPLVLRHEDAMYNIYKFFSQKRIPKFEKIIIAIEVYKRIHQDHGLEFEQLFIPRDETVVTPEEANEKLPDEDELVPEARVWQMKNRRGKREECYTALATMYADMLRDWADSDNPYLQKAPEAAYRDSDSFSYIYILTLCKNMKFGLGALDILTKNYDIEALEECFNA